MKLVRYGPPGSERTGLITYGSIGVGAFMDPPCFLKAGNLVEMKIEGLGEQRNKVV
jgi:2-keto-4-pentenoate hydratase/2-oxohepta-3-ene-1,7-dioic acid hydratase in catechol pathway